jgi:asparagine synthase (glutamine-hydrolysing)
MCGITGILRLNGSGAVPLDTLKRMTAVLEHRGPDEAGIYLDDTVGLGHTRLSIIDLSSGQQPMHNGDERLWIAYNGEIFNYVELRQDLEKKGYRFRTSSDTEVLIHLYEDEGENCLQHLNGQFAFAIWDVKKKELFLARDRVGIRPLHYTIHGDTFVFSSEIKSIFMYDGVPREIDPVALEQIFTFWTTLPGRTAFENIKELPPGHCMKISGGKTTIKKYWDIPLFSPEEHVDQPPQEIADEIQEILLDAIRIRLRADVPVGAYLSGGLDSSGVTALVVKHFDNAVKTFGIRFDHDAFDEGSYQTDMVSFLQANHEEIRASNEAIGAALPEVLWHCEKPLLRTAPTPLFMLSDLVHKNGLKVVLTGEGADEVFGGYNIFRETKLRKFWSKQPDSKLRPELIGKLYPYIFHEPRLKRTLQAFFAKGLDRPDDPLFSHMIRWDNTSKIKLLFSKALKERIGDYDGYEEVRQLLPSSYADWDCVVKAQYLETAIFLSNYLLSSQGDRVAMAHSMEIRLPYLDPRLMEFMGRVPSKWKLFGLDEKYILKRSFANVLPQHIAQRSKHPYRAPISESLLNDQAAEQYLEILSKDNLARSGLFDPAKVARLVKSLQGPGAEREVNNMALVGILSAQIIFENFVEEFPTTLHHAKQPDVVIDRRRDAMN